MDVLTPEQRSRNMQAIKSKKTKIEEILAKALWAKGFRYRRNNKKVFGKPDFTFRKLKIAIFLLKSGWKVIRFWGQDIKKNTDFCISQIEKVIEEQKHDKLL
jgi:DNA mismatch endonuclease (patch repair protein)